MKKERLKIKICGMKDARNIQDIANLMPDYMGFIFYPRSPRCCDGLDPEIVKILPEGIVTVAVTVDETEEEILSHVAKYGFKAIQLHGSESPELCRRLKDKGLIVLKAISINGSESLDKISSYEGCVDMFVFDTASRAKGGSGRKFDWELLKSAPVHTPFLLSGGIGPDDLEAVESISLPYLEGIDLNSRFETCPGVKDVSLLSGFISGLQEK